MFCGNCGSLLNDNEAICPNCQTVNSDTTVNVNSNNQYEQYKQNEQSLKNYGFNKLLVYSILELLCCFQIFGIIALILLFTQLKPAVEQGRIVEADKVREQVKTILIIGLVLGIIINIFYLGLQFLPVIVTLVESVSML